MKLATIFEELRANRRYATTADILNFYGDYHNLLRWLAGFLLRDEKVADECIIDASTIAESQTPDFHEWLVHWAARATVRCALQKQHAAITDLALTYEKIDSGHPKHYPLSPENFLALVKNSDDIHTRLDVLCRCVLVLRGIAKHSCNDIAAQLGIGRNAVEQAYCVAFDTLERASAVTAVKSQSTPVMRQHDEAVEPIALGNDAKVAAT